METTPEFRDDESSNSIRDDESNSSISDDDLEQQEEAATLLAVPADVFDGDRVSPHALAHLQRSPVSPDLCADEADE